MYYNKGSRNRMWHDSRLRYGGPNTGLRLFIIYAWQRSVDVRSVVSDEQSAVATRAVPETSSQRWAPRAVPEEAFGQEEVVGELMRDLGISPAPAGIMGCSVYVPALQLRYMRIV